jgi:hypothetical protein
VNHNNGRKARNGLALTVRRLILRDICNAVAVASNPVSRMDHHREEKRGNWQLEIHSTSGSAAFATMSIKNVMKGFCHVSMDIIEIV